MEEKYGISTKQFMREELKEKFKSSPNFFITNYKGLDALQLDTLRKELNKSASKYFVVKNSIVKRVFDELDMKEFSQFIKGEVGIGFIGDVVGASKIFVQLSKKHPSFKLNCAFLDGNREGADRIKHLATLPPKEVLMALALLYMKSPITGFVGVLKNLLRNFVYAINEIKNKKEEK
ncbi:MAG: 50S ribosomal protein L10 [Candidatus Omnitrophota bacterium]|nr:MAG: 50S ribosomal protein L10 [Candidatus Omnitrophota bacterium]